MKGNFLDAATRHQLTLVYILCALTVVICNNNETSTKEICTTSECLKVAKMLKSSMNESVHPCENFYNFACGGWVQQNSLPDDEFLHLSQFDVVEEQLASRVQGILSSRIAVREPHYMKKVKIFYRACLDTARMNTRGLAPFFHLLDSYGGWPLLHGVKGHQGHGWNESAFDFQAVIIKATLTLDLPLIFKIFLEADLMDSSRLLISLDQMEFFLPKKYLMDPKYRSQVDSYHDFVRNVALEMARELKITLDDKELNESISDFIRLETKLAEVSADMEDRTNNSRVYNLFKVFELQEYFSEYKYNKYSHIQWPQFLNELFKNIATIPNYENINVRESSYLFSAFHILKETPVRTVANYLLWRVICIVLDETTDAMRKISNDYLNATEGIIEEKNRRETCSDLNLDEDYFPLGYAVSHEYLPKYFSPEAKQTINSMVHYLRKAFNHLLDEADWMDASTTKKAAKKLELMSQFIGYPEWITNSTALEHFYKGLVVRKDLHFENRLALFTWKVQYELQKYGKPTDRTMYNRMDSHAVFVNAYYVAERNSITFPAGILASPFFSYKGPASVNFGSIGSVIGHEITHGFDDSGSQYDENGNGIKWWSPQMMDRFNERTACMKNQYDRFHTSQGNVNGYLTVGENIADNGGLHQAFRAYQDWKMEGNNSHGDELKLRLPGLEKFSHDQLFFLGFANTWCSSWTPEKLKKYLISNEHSPGEFRAIGPIQNSVGFAKAFNCPVGSPMNPENKCMLW